MNKSLTAKAIAHELEVFKNDEAFAVYLKIWQALTGNEKAWRFPKLRKGDNYECSSIQESDRRH